MLWIILCLVSAYQLLQLTDPIRTIEDTVKIPISISKTDDSQDFSVGAWTLSPPPLPAVLFSIHSSSAPSPQVLRLSKFSQRTLILSASLTPLITVEDDLDRERVVRWEFVLVSITRGDLAVIQLCIKGWGATALCRKEKGGFWNDDNMVVEVGKSHEEIAILGLLVVFGELREGELEGIMEEKCLEGCLGVCWGPGLHGCSEYTSVIPDSELFPVDSEVRTITVHESPSTAITVTMWVLPQPHFSASHLFTLSSDSSSDALSTHLTPNGSVQTCLKTEEGNRMSCSTEAKLSVGEWSLVVVAQLSAGLRVCWAGLEQQHVECESVDALAGNSRDTLRYATAVIGQEHNQLPGGAITDFRLYRDYAFSNADADTLFAETVSECEETSKVLCDSLRLGMETHGRRLSASHAAVLEYTSTVSSGYFYYYTVTNNHANSLYITFDVSVSDGYVCIYISKPFKNSSSYLWFSCKNYFYQSVYLTPTSSNVAATGGLKGTYTIQVFPYKWVCFWRCYMIRYSPRVYVHVYISCSNASSSCFCNSGFYPAPTTSSCRVCPAGNSLCPSAAANYCLPFTTSTSPASTFACQTCYDTRMTYDLTYGCGCHPPCSTCFASGPNSCNSCSTGAVLVGTSCACTAGYYFISASSFYCGVCSSKCATCSGGSDTQCLSCKVNAAFSSGACACVDGFGGTADNCQICHVSCLKCQTTNANSCKVCKPLAMLQGTAPSYCVCLSGYYPNPSSGSCALCNVNCLTCSGANSNNCLSCKSNAYLSSSACYCISGYYGAPSSCQPCDPSCQACSGAGNNNCTTCKLNATLQTPSPNVCKCNSSFCMNPSGTCVVCHVYCASCSGPSDSQCLTCKSNAALLAGKCVCNASFFPNPSVDKCASCNSLCSQCVGSSATQCTSCYPNAGLAHSITPSSCSCLGGFYPNSSPASCSPCSSLCKTCGTSASACTSCFFPAVLGSSTCNCPSEYFANPTAQNCSLCHYSCETCSGPGDQDCIDCPSGSPPIDGACSCSDVNCVTCHITCKDCLGKSAGYCVTCNTGAHLLDPVHPTLGTSTCVCDTGLYRDGKDCNSCYETCAQCTGPNNTDCSECYANASLVGAAPNECKCKVGFFYDGGTKLCVACDSSCLTCDSAGSSSCLSCFPNASLQPPAPKSACACDPHFFTLSTASQCHVCDSTCKECSDDTKSGCTHCFASAELKSGECVCIEHYFPDPTSVLCKVCDATCKNCIGPGSLDCVECLANAELESGTGPSKCVCSISAFSKTTSAVCAQCHNDCYRCVDGSPSDCSECYKHAYLAGGKAVSSCACDPLYLPMPSVKSCILCHSTCKKCSQEGEAYCTECYTYAALENDPSPSKCVCLPGYYAPISTVECILCFDTCKKCIGTGEFECTECFQNAELTDGLSPSSCQCKEFTFPDITPRNCKKCDVTCKKCVDTTPSSCSECFLYAVFDPDLPPSTCVCLDTAFTLTNASQCLPCDDACARCLGPSASDCSDCFEHAELTKIGTCECVDGYYPNPSANMCVLCHETCRHCSSNTENDCTDCYPGASLAASICICTDEFFPDPNSGHCSPCAPTCFNCLSSAPDKCSSCHPHASLPSGSDIAACLCDSGFFPDPTPRDCIACHPHCYECVGDSPSDCVVCPSFAELVAAPPSECGCAEDSFPDPNVTNCSLCSLTCRSCLAAGLQSCVSCKNSAELAGASPNSCKCRVGFYASPDASNCLPCLSVCGSCESVYECTSCKPGGVLRDQVCECGERYFPDPDASSCAPCSDGCEKCSRLRCLLCQLGLYVLVTRCVAECPYGYRATERFECEAVDMSQPAASLMVSQDNSLNLLFNKSMTFADVSAKDFEVEVRDSTNQPEDVLWSDPETPDSQTLVLKLVFGQHYIPEDTSVQLTLLSPSKILDVNDVALNTTVFTGSLYEFGSKPQNLTPSVLSSPAAQSAAAAGTAATSSGLAISVISGNPATLISMVNQMQLLSYIAMSKIDMSEDLRATLAAINMGSAFSMPFLTDPLQVEESRPSPVFAQLYGLPSPLFLRNAGSVLVVSAATLLAYVPIYLLSKVPNQFIAKYFGKMLPSVRWGVPIKLWLTSYLDIGIFSFMQVRWAGDPFSSLFPAVNFVIGSFFFTLTVATPFVLARHIYRHYSEYSGRCDPDFCQKWGCLVNEFKPSAKPSITGFYIAFAVRRLLGVASLTLMADLPELVACINTSMSLAMLIYLIACRPHVSVVDQLANITNEGGICFVFLVVSSFSFCVDADIRSLLSDIGVWGIRLALFANLGFALTGLGLKCAEVMKQYSRAVKVHDVKGGNEAQIRREKDWFPGG